jgi:hypothetical protein
MGDLEQLIRERAYLLWEQAGCPDGRSEEFWFVALHEVAGEAPSDDVPEGTLAPLAEEPPGIAAQFGIPTGMPGERIAEQGVIDGAEAELAIPELADAETD